MKSLTISVDTIEKNTGMGKLDGVEVYIKGLCMIPLRGKQTWCLEYLGSCIFNWSAYWMSDCGSNEVNVTQWTRGTNDVKAGQDQG